MKPGPDSREFAAALDFHQGRRYQEALAGFRKIRRSETGLEADIAAFYEMEALRKSGDLDGFEKALTGFKGHSSLDANRLRQLEINRLRDSVRKEQWERANALVSRLDAAPLPADQRSQVAFCRGLALENRGQPAEALIAYNVAMTADAGASEDVARLAAIRVMTLHLADPEVRAAMDRWDRRRRPEHSGTFPAEGSGGGRCALRAFLGSRIALASRAGSAFEVSRRPLNDRLPLG